MPFECCTRARASCEKSEKVPRAKTRGGMFILLGSSPATFNRFNSYELESRSSEVEIEIKWKEGTGGGGFVAASLSFLSGDVMDRLPAWFVIHVGNYQSRSLSVVKAIRSRRVCERIRKIELAKSDSRSLSRYNAIKLREIRSVASAMKPSCSNSSFVDRRGLSPAD